MSERFQGLSEQEQAACLIAERVLGVVAEPWDVGGRQGVVDAMLVYPTGRRAAFEVTALSGDGALQTVSLLASIMRAGFDGAVGVEIRYMMVVSRFGVG